MIFTISASVSGNGWKFWGQRRSVFSMSQCVMYQCQAGWNSGPECFSSMNCYLEMDGRKGNLGKWEGLSEMNKEAISDLLASSDKAMKVLLFAGGWNAGDGCARALPPWKRTSFSAHHALSWPHRHWPRPSGKPGSSTPTCRSQGWWCTKKPSWRRGKSKVRAASSVLCPWTCWVIWKACLHHGAFLLQSVWSFSLNHPQVHLLRWPAFS